MTLEVHGKPAAKQSARFFRGAVVGITKTNRALREWTSAIASRAAELDGVERWAGHSTYEVEIRFRMPGAEDGPHTSVPDVDNLAKAVLDALQAVGIIDNDSRVVKLVVYKVKVKSNPGARIEVKRMP